MSPELINLNTMEKFGNVDKWRPYADKKASKERAKKIRKMSDGEKIKMLNAGVGYPLYGLPEGFDIPKTFGAGTFLGLPVLILSLFPLFFPFWLLIVTAETGFPDLFIFDLGMQISFVPVQIMGAVLHLILLFAGGRACRKFGQQHYGVLLGRRFFRTHTQKRLSNVAKCEIMSMFSADSVEIS